jgi:hypothetical protein
MKWVKLADQKPDEGQMVLFWNVKMIRPVVGFMRDGKIEYVHNFHIVPIGETFPWDLNGRIAPVYPSACSHWIPIPKEPEI